MPLNLSALFDELRAPQGALCAFPRREETRAAFLQAAQDLCAVLADREIGLTPAPAKHLLIKLARYCGKRQWDVQALSGQIPTLADAIAQKPDVLTDQALSLSKVVKLHDMHNRQSAASLRRSLLADPNTDLPPELVAWCGKKKYKLVECKTQRHLQEESAALGHCVGAGSLDHYLGKLRDGGSRLFSLRTARNVPLATIEYDVRSRDIVQIEGKPRKIAATAPFFPALCEALFALSQKIEVREIKGLPDAPNGVVLLSTGKWVAMTKLPRGADILLGEGRVDNATPQELLTQLSRAPRLLLDVTDLDLSRLPEVVDCRLESKARTFIAPSLRMASHISAIDARSFKAPQLQRAGDIVAPACQAFEAAQLQKAKDIWLPNCQTFMAPQLRESGDIGIPSARTFDAPQLRQAGSITISSAQTIDAPQLRLARNIAADCAATFNAPLLQLAEDIEANALQTLAIPRLRKAGSIMAEKIKIFDAPLLQQIDDIEVEAATAFKAPQLRHVGNISAPNAKIFDTPKLRQVRNIEAPNAETFDIPKLHEAGDIGAYSTLIFNAPHLQQAGNIWTSTVISFAAPQLQTAAIIRAKSAEVFDAPSLETVEELHLSPRADLNVPSLREGRVFIENKEVPLASLAPRAPAGGKQGGAACSCGL